MLHNLLSIMYNIKCVKLLSNDSWIYCLTSIDICRLILVECHKFRIVCMIWFENSVSTVYVSYFLTLVIGLSKTGKFFRFSLAKKIQKINSGKTTMHDLVPAVHGGVKWAFLAPCHGAQLDIPCPIWPQHGAIYAFVLIFSRV